MAAADEAAASKLVEVLSRIDTTLGALDRRLQTLERSWPPAQAGAIVPATSAGADPLQITDHGCFVAEYKLHADGLIRLQQIIVVDNDLLALLRRTSSPCLDRHQTRQATNDGHKTFTYPFTELLSYRDILKFLIHESEQPDTELRSLYSDYTTNHVSAWRDETVELLACCNRQCEALIGGRDDNMGRGVVLFDDLPTLFSPGMLLVGPGGEGLEQVVEVSSCDMATGITGTEACVVQVWHFRWDGRGFSRTSSHFELGRYSGTRPIKGFPYHPVIGLDAEQSVTRLREVIARNKKNLASLQEISKVDVGDYPLCIWESKFSDGFRNGSRVAQAILDPAAFSLYNEEPPKTATFGCYCARCTSSVAPETVFQNARYLLLAPTRVEGFLLQQKKWTTFPICDLHPDEPYWWDAETLETVALGESTVEFLKEKITEHFAWRKEVLEGTNPDPLEVQDDISRKAFVVQFYGPEGVGKALTASSLADYSHRPSLCLSPDDMGLEPEIFANRLSLYSELSFRWGAVLILSETDNVLHSRRRDGSTRSRFGEALARTLERFGGAMILLSSDLPSLDTHLVRYIRPIAFPPPSPLDIANMFSSYLERLDPPDFVESAEDMQEWVLTTAAKLQLTVREFRDIFQRAAAHANRDNQKLNLSGVIKAYTTTTGRPDEWKLVDDTSLYASDRPMEGTITPVVTEVLRDVFGSWSELPDDGRLPLTLFETFYCGAPPDAALKAANALGKATEELQKVGGMWIVDWGWPRGLWHPLEGCAYTPNRLYRWVAPQVKRPQEEWARAGFTMGLADIIHSREHRRFRSGGPWRRLVLIEGLTTIPLKILEDASQALEEIHEDDPMVSRYLPWVGARHDNRPSSLSLDERLHSMDRIVRAHVEAKTLESPRLVASIPRIARLGTLHQDLEYPVGPDLEFHIVFFDMRARRERTGNVGGLRNRSRFFGAPNISMRKGCFTIFPVPSVGNSPTQTGPIHWTLICLTPEFFLSQDTYTTCAAPTLRAQTMYYVAEALRIVVARWREVLRAIENLVDSDSVLRQPDQLQDILFDDDAFSTSKRYFWAINFIHEAVKLLDDSIQQWANFRKRSVTPWITVGSYSEREYYWFEKSQKVLDTADQTAEESCEDLKRLRQEFQEKLERITIMRDGLFNASAVMESRASTQLGENVKLLTFVSIFFLPLGLCMAIWSINESYSSTNLAIVTVVVAVATYALTFNLNNVVHGLKKVYTPKRKTLIEQMERDPRRTWRWFGSRFKVFERTERGQQKPSEWIVWAYVFRRMWRAVLGRWGSRPESAPDETRSGWSL